MKKETEKSRMESHEHTPHPNSKTHTSGLFSGLLDLYYNKIEHIIKCICHVSSSSWIHCLSFLLTFKVPLQFPNKFTCPSSSVSSLGDKYYNTFNTVTINVATKKRLMIYYFFWSGHFSLRLKGNNINTERKWIYIRSY